MRVSISSPGTTLNTSAIILPVPAAPPLFGLSPEERLRRMLELFPVEIRPTQEVDSLPSGVKVLVLRGDAVYERALLEFLLASSGLCLVDAFGNPLVASVDGADAAAAIAWMNGARGVPPAVSVQELSSLEPVYNRALRKRQPLYAEAVTPANRRAVEKRIYQKVYKGVTDLVTKYLWPRPALFLTRLFLSLGIGANAVTCVSILFMALALAAFAQGAFGWGLLAGWIMALLDTVDGKMARVSLTSSTLGNLLDHGMDLIHPPFWYLAWLAGLSTGGHALPEAWFEPVAALIFGTYIGVRLCEGYFIRRFGFEVHVWRPADSFFRLIVARRNSNLIILTLFWLIGRPDWGILFLVGWQLVALIVHLVRIFQAEYQAARGNGPRSWLDTPLEPGPAR